MEVLVLLVIFSSITFIAYLFLSGRHKERMALIENDKDISILKPIPRVHTSWTLKIGLLLLFGGAGILIGHFMNFFLGINEEVAIPSFLFMSAGSGLLIYYWVIRNIAKEENEQL